MDAVGAAYNFRHYSVFSDLLSFSEVKPRQTFTAVKCTLACVHVKLFCIFFPFFVVVVVVVKTVYVNTLPLLNFSVVHF